MNKKKYILTLVAVGLDETRASLIEDTGHFMFPEVVYKSCQYVVKGKTADVYVDCCMMHDDLDYQDVVELTGHIWTSLMIEKEGVQESVFEGL